MNCSYWFFTGAIGVVIIVMFSIGTSFLKLCTDLEPTGHALALPHGMAAHQCTRRVSHCAGHWVPQPSDHTQPYLLYAIAIHLPPATFPHLSFSQLAPWNPWVPTMVVIEGTGSADSNKWVHGQRTPILSLLVCRFDFHVLLGLGMRSLASALYFRERDWRHRFSRSRWVHAPVYPKSSALGIRNPLHLVHRLTFGEGICV